MTIREAYEGGTAMGAVQVYPARRLHRKHGLPDRVDGVSIGSVTAWARATGHLVVLDRVWRGIGGSSDFQRLRWWWPFGGLYDFTPLVRLLRSEVAQHPVLVPCYAHCVDLASKGYERLPLHDLTPSQRVDAVIASCSQYGIHKAALFDGRSKADGGARHSIPWVPDHYDQVWAVCCSPASAPWDDNHIDPADVSITRGLEVLLDSLQAKDYALLCHHAAKADVWLVEPHERYGKPFDARAKTIAHRLDVVGPAAWRNRRQLAPLTPEDIPRILTGA